MPGGRQTQVQKSMKKDGLIRHLARGRGGGGVRCQEGGADTRSKTQRRENVLESLLPEDRGGAGVGGGAIPMAGRRVGTRSKVQGRENVLVSLLHKEKEKTVAGRGQGGGGDGEGYDARKAGRDTRSKVQGRGCAGEALA